MSNDDIKYFKIEKLSGVEYIAGLNGDKVIDSLGNFNNPKSLASLFYYDFNSLMETTREEAFKYSDLEKNNDYNLCPDGTFIIGFRKRNFN